MGEPLLSTFLNFRAVNTQRSYALVWSDWLSSIPVPAALATAEHVIEYMAKLRRRIAADGEPLSDATVRHRFHALRSIYEFLFDVGEVSHNPFRKAGRLISWRQQIQKRPTQLINESLIYKIISDLKKDDSPRSLQNAALLSFLFGGGLRRGEVVKIKMRDVSFDHERFCRVVLTRTKAGRVQTQTLPLWASESIFRYIKYRLGAGAKDDSKLFPFCCYTLYRKYKKILASYGVTAAPHSARASACTALLRHGCSERDAAIFLRHNTTQQVQVYDKRNRELEQNPGQWIRYDVRKKVRRKRKK